MFYTFLSYFANVIKKPATSQWTDSFANRTIIELLKIENKIVIRAFLLPLAIYSKPSYDSCQNIRAMCMILTLKNLRRCMYVRIRIKVGKFVAANLRIECRKLNVFAKR